MEEITEKEAQELKNQSEKETEKILEDGGKITKTEIREKDKITTIIKIEPVNGEATSSTTVQNKNEIIINYA